MTAGKKYFFIFILLISCCGSLHAQLSTLRCKWIKPSANTFILDTLSIQPGSISASSAQGEKVSVDYDINTNQAFIKGNSPQDSIQVCYRVFPFNLSKPYFKRDISLYDSNQIYSENMAYGSVPEQREEIFSTPGINKTGVITRGITVGNTQNVFVNSSLNLQLEGKLNDDISMIAAISDQNVPFQPEGNTQTINEFDKVFIKFYNKKGSLTAGDIVLQNKTSNFLRFYRNVQGGQFETHLSKNEKNYSNTSVSAAISKGKFASILLDALEGVQGPYRLKVSDNERFIIVIANSERIFLDGKLLQRGYNYDYVIDYNQAEITFTNAVLITKYSRIRVDMEYAERNYSRTIISASHNQSIGKASFNFNYFNQKDNPRNPLLIDLSEADKILLSDVGDSLSQAVAPTIDSVEFDPNHVQYKRVDTVTASGTYEAYVYSTDQSNAYFQISFAEVGNGKGDYIISNSTANGRVMVWVEPINGIPAGNYAPVRLLPAPSKNEMITFGGAFNFSATDRAYFETALSNRDLNLFSSNHDKDNQGLAYKVGYDNTGRKVSFLKGYNWVGAIDYEFNSQTFNPIDRFRSIEFNRDWSVGLTEVLTADENIFNAGGGLVKDSNERVEYKFTRRVRGSYVNGYQHTASLYERAGKFYLKSDFFYLNNNRPNINSQWQRFKADLNYASKIIVPGYTYELDKNEIRQNQTKNVISSAMHYDEHKFYVRNADSLNTKFLLDYSYRVNKTPVNGEVKKRDNVQMINASFGRAIGANNVNVTLTYRNLENLLDSLNGKREETVMARIDANQYLLNRNVRSELTFYTFTGRELKREFIYLNVPTGEGTHTWRDENEDGIKDLNEFYEAINPDEKNYVKFFVPTDQYIQAFTSNFNYRLNISTPIKWRTSTGYKKVLSHFSVIASWTIDKKTTSSNLEARILPFTIDVLNPNIISFREALRSTLFFNKTHSTYGLDLNYYSTKYKQPLTNGFELKKKDEYRLNSRLNLNNTVNTKVALLFSETGATSDYLATRNYQINSYKVSPELAFQPKNNFRISAIYSYTFKNNQANPEDGKLAIFNEVLGDVKWNKLSNRTIQTVLKYTQIKYSGPVNTAVSYEMLEALRPGNNLSWSFNWLQKLSNGLQLSINYEGRKSESQKVIHVGRMQVSALF